MSTPFASLAPRVLPLVPGCPFSLAQAALRDAAAEFCARTLVWREDLPANNLVAENPFYTLTPPAGARVVMVLSVLVQDRPLLAANDDLLDDQHPGWRALSPAEPTRYLLPRPGEIRLVPAPAHSSSGSLVAHVALAPAKDATEADDALMETYDAAFVHGALAELLGFTGLSWASPERSAHHARQFRAAIADARALIAKGGTTLTLAARPRAFGGL